MSRQQPAKRPKLDSGLAPPPQSTGWGQTAVAPGRTHTAGQAPTGGLALPSGGSSGYARPQYAATQASQPQQQPDAVIDPALHAASAYPPAPAASSSVLRSTANSSQPSASQQQTQPRMTATEQAQWDEYVRKYYEYYGAPPPPNTLPTVAQASAASAYPQQQSTAAAYQLYQQRMSAQQSQQSQQSQPTQPSQESQPASQQSQQTQQQPAYSQYAQLLQQQQQQQQTQQYALPTPGPQSQVRRGRPMAQKLENKETINDALGSAGVDLRAEEDAIHRSYDAVPGSYPVVAHPRDDRSRKQTFMPPIALMKRVSGTAAGHSIKTVSSDAASYIALAAQTHLTTLLRGALAASKNRQPGTNGVTRPPGLYPQPAAAGDDLAAASPLPMWSQEVTRDLGKQIAAIERVQRDNELQARLKKREREEAANAATNGTAVPEEEQPKKKKKKEGPGVAARNMSEDVRKRLSDAVAMRAAGNTASKYSWLQAGAAAASAPIQPVKKKDKPRDAESAAATPVAAAGSGSGGGSAPTPGKKGMGSGWGRAYQSLKDEAKDTRRKVEVRDVIWAMEGRAGSGVPSGGEKGVGRGGRGGTRWRGWEAWGRIRE